MAKHPTSRSFYTWLVLILWAFCMALLSSSNGYAVTAPGTSIVNVATASYQLGGNPVTVSSTQTITTSSCSTQGIDIQLMQYIASSIQA